MPLQKILVLLALWILINHPTLGQYVLYLKAETLPITEIKKTFNDSLQRALFVGNVLQGFQRKGFWYAHIKDQIFQGDSLRVVATLGEPIKWNTLRFSGIEKIFLDNVSLQSFDNQVFDIEIWEKTSQAILQNAENKGYPFAQIQLDSIQISNNQVFASINFQKGYLVVWDSIEIKGNLKIKPSFLKKYLLLKKNDAYSVQQLARSERLLKNLGFVKLVKPTEVSFENQGAKVVFFANQSQSNEIDAVLGFMPNELQQGKLLLTGQAQVHLRNLFSSAKSLDIDFQQLKPRHQLLDILYKHPFLFNSKLSAEGYFKLLREDTSFVNINRRLGFYYPLSAYSQIRLFGGQQNSQLGFTPSLASNTLPINQENKYVFYGFGYEWNNLDNIFLPKNGLQTIFIIQTGNKTIVPLPFLADSLYNSIPLKSLQTKIEGNFRYYALRKKNGLYVRLEGALLLSPFLLQSDLYRLGGLISLRGFNQNFFFASKYALSTVEYRYFWEEEAFFSVFYDQAVLEETLLGKSSAISTPLGLGAGVSFKTKGGIFSLNYALGNTPNQTFSVTRSKLHFGFISRF